MVPLTMLKYKENFELDRAVTRFVNNQILAILNYFYDVEFDNDFQQPILPLVPNGCYRDKNFSYERKLAEVKGLLSDNVLRSGNLYLTPLNEYVIYKVIECQIEFCEDEQETTLIDVDDDLKARIEQCQDYFTVNDENEPYNYVLNDISDLRNYLSFLFYDLDFLEQNATTIISLFLKGYLFDEYDEKGLEDLLPMVADDVYEKYKVRRAEDVKMQERDCKINISVGDNHGTINTGDVFELNNTSADNSKLQDSGKKHILEKYIIPIAVALIGAAATIISALIK